MTSARSSAGRHFAASDSLGDEAFDLPEGADPRDVDAAGKWCPGRSAQPARGDAPVDGLKRSEKEAPLGTTPSPKRPKKQRSTAGKILRVLLVALLVIVLALVIAAGAAFLWLRQSVSTGEQKILDASRPTAAASSALADSQPADAPYVPTLDNTITYQGQKYAPNEKMISVAFIGYDGAETGGTVGQADAVIVLTMNLETGAVKAISIPRDSMVDVDEYVGDAYIGQQTMQLCLAYSYGDGGASSSEHVASLASRILYDVPISYYFTLNLEGIGAVNDAVGGVTLTPQQTIPNTSIVAGEPITLWGEEALRYVRWRDSANPEAETTSSLDRQSRQLQYLQAFATQVMQNATGDPAALVNLYNTASQYAFTNLGLDEFTYLATQVLQTGLGSLEMTSLPGEMQMGAQYAEFYLDKQGVRQIVMDTFYHPVSSGPSGSKNASSSSASTAGDAGESSEPGKLSEEPVATGEPAEEPTAAEGLAGEPAAAEGPTA